MICVAVTYVIKPGHEAEAVTLFRTITTHTRAEPGCRMYLAHRSPAEPRRFFLYEQYNNTTIKLPSTLIEPRPISSVM
jgi:(4S)-4-hydroxy-5-phosphonooxypentane-2,3-dione isomerase